MADLQRGDEVIAVQDISVGIFSSVPKGPRGVVTDTSGFFTTQYTVSFENGQKAENVDGNAIRAI